VVSHRAAAELWGFSRVVAEGIELTVDAPLRARLPGVTRHQTTLLPAPHRAIRDGIPVTSAARTLADLSRTSISTRLPGLLVDDGLRRSLLDPEEPRGTSRELTTRGRRVLTRLGLVLDDRQPGYVPGDSEPERRTLRWLVAAGRPPPEQQHQVEVGHTVYLLDLAYPQERIGIEYDGWDGHGTRSALDHGVRRGNALSAAGWTVVHFTSATTATELVATVRSLRAKHPSQV